VPLVAEGIVTMKQLVLFFLLLVAACASKVQPKDACPIPSSETEKMLSLNLDAFDQDTESGWRGVAAVESCELRAANLIQAYVKRNKANIPSNGINTLKWHLGQMWANAGETNKAISAFRETLKRGDETQKLYAEATIAFLRRDRFAFDLARAKLAAAPQPPGWTEAVARFQQKYNRPGPIWPANLDVVDRMGRCFDSPYSIAYGGTC
jgi:hypothetical protein